MTKCVQDVNLKKFKCKTELSFSYHYPQNISKCQFLYHTILATAFHSFAWYLTLRSILRKRWSAQHQSSPRGTFIPAALEISSNQWWFQNRRWNESSIRMEELEAHWRYHSAGKWPYGASSEWILIMGEVDTTDKIQRHEFKWYETVQFITQRNHFYQNLLLIAVFTSQSMPGNK